ncbi:MAG: PHP domain-containing protein [Deltaproteobacteria bacterium]|nr:PHP domain-containing protein [Deltaproteobacteria bacterium]
MRLDLHCHSLHSDGTLPVSQIVSQAKARALELFCLTDHDTLAGFDEVKAGLPGVTVLRGLELSTHGHGRTIHLLLYGVTEGAASCALEGRLATLREQRRQRIFEICSRLTRWNITLDAEVIVAKSGHGTAGRPHVAAALVAAGVCKSVREAFDRFLGDKGPAMVPSPRLSVEEGLALASSCAAKVSLAHPHLVGPPELVKALCKEWKPLGLGGIEAEYGMYAQRQRALWSAVGDDVGLIVTAGSDFHGTDVVPDVPHVGVELHAARALPLRDWLLS